MDGDGCITMHEKRYEHAPSVYVPVITGGGVNKAVLQYFISLFPNNYATFIVHREQGENHKKSWRFQFVGRNCIEVLKQFAPYLKLKAPVAKLVLNFPKRRRAYGKQTPDWAGAAKQAKVLKQVRKLNKRGLK